MVRTLALRSAVGGLAVLVATAGLMAPAQAMSGPPAPASALVGWGIPDDPPGSGAPVAAYTLPEDLQGTTFTKVIPAGDFTLALTAAGKIAVLGTPGNPSILPVLDIPSSVASGTVTDITQNDQWAGAVTADGKARVWGLEDDQFQDPTDVPGDLTDVARLAIGAGYHAAAVKTNGDVVMWGYLDDGGNANVPANIGTGVKALVAGSDHYYALKADGNVVAWGKNDKGQTTLPADVSSGGHVEQIESGTKTGLALMDDGSLEEWGQDTASNRYPVPESLSDKNVVQIAAAANMYAALDDTGAITVWGGGTAPAALSGLTVPAELAQGDVAGLGLGSKYLIALVTPTVVETPVAEVNKPTIAGTPTVGQTLTGTPGTFSGDPEEIANQWYAGDEAIEGETGNTLELTAAQVGKTITFRSTATKGEATPVVSTSTATAEVTDAVVVPVPVNVVNKPTIAGTAKVGETLTGTPGTFSGDPTITNQWLANGEAISGANGTELVLTAAQLGRTITFRSTATRGEDAPVVSTSVATAEVASNLPASTTSISAPSSTYGVAGKVTVSVSSAGGPATDGSVFLLGTDGWQIVPVTAGKAVVTLSKTLTPNKYELTALYFGSAELASSVDTAVKTVAKAKTKKPTYKATKTPTSKKTGKATITVPRTSGSLIAASGKVTVTLKKKGQSTKTVKATLSSGKKSITLPKLKKGTWSVVVTYAGDSRYVSQKSSTYSLKIKK